MLSVAAASTAMFHLVDGGKKEDNLQILVARRFKLGLNWVFKQ